MIRHSTLRNSIAVSFVLLTACAQTSPDVSSAATPSVATIPAQQPANSQGLTLQQIMADPKWIGFAPHASHWHWDSSAVYYDQKVSEQTYYQRVKLDLQGNTETPAIEQRYQTDMEDGVNSADGKLRAYVFGDNLFLADLTNGEVTQLTRSSDKVSQPQFLTDGRIAFRQNDLFMALDLATGIRQQLADIREEDSPKPPAKPEGFVAEEQHKLIEWIANKQKRAERRFDTDQEWQQKDPSATAEPIYLGKEHELLSARLSPTGRFLLLAYAEDRDERADSDIMPNYITHDGTIETQSVRPRVADSDPAPLQMMLVDNQTGGMTILDLSVLPGMDDDVFKAVRAANKKAYGDAYDAPEPYERQLQLMENWGGGYPSIIWHPSKDIALMMVEAVDNKDRWIASVDESGVIKSQHRLHDDAWVNYSFNEYGWLGDDIYYLSEQMGYSNLYLKTLNGKTRKLVGGQQEVQSLTVSDDGAYIYYVANPAHPGIYDVFRVATDSGEVTQLTDLNGMTSYLLSPDGEQLLLTYSNTTSPQELWVTKADGNEQPRQLSNTVNAEFKAIEWQQPEIIAMPSAHDDLPVYARVFYPQGYDASRAEQYPAVMFVHGAGYLQNAHAGWSGYFREFMFHNLLAEQGYVVMDIDYRGSKGYGRDVRTAIYRNMGYPEVEDMATGVQWMATNANVDAQRVGVYGGSYGGFLTFMALFNEPDLFAAGAALRPVSDWAHYNAPYTSNILNTPEVDPQAYRVSSPIYHAEGLTKPLLINAPMLDNNVFFQDVVRLVQRLIELEKDDFETAIFPVEPHSFKEPSSWLDEYKRIHKLFEQNLKP
ncbi:prolyl oligopeptidase family serine peptidase [Neiella marina]|uniref:Prolyl oligopeptidase family serine peptidase n=1 Tax=Neiella holothuriorum TaxID=2870530 RepID=A0ABS7EFQ1_9GAMM|nr:prolyl oligopeptidase family serine peptidase [Neiella holothuriorum]MBW8191045.1 prolyl oligopeptidase family serine peptidase [Neiella holothuriorum]